MKTSGFLQEGNRGTGALRFHIPSFCLLLCSHFMTFLRYLWAFFLTFCWVISCLNNCIIIAIADVLIPTIRHCKISSFGLQDLQTPIFRFSYITSSSSFQGPKHNLSASVKFDQRVGCDWLQSIWFKLLWIQLLKLKASRSMKENCYLTIKYLKDCGVKKGFLQWHLSRSTLK